MAPEYENENMEKFQNKMGWMGKLSSLNAPGIEIYLWHPILVLGVSPLPMHYWPFGVIRNGSSVWRWKRLINIRTKWAEWAANKLVWMPQALDYINFFLTIGLVVCSGQTIFRLEIRHFSQAHWTQRSYMFSRNLQKNSSRISSILKVARNYYDHCVKWASLFDSVK